MFDFLKKKRKVEAPPPKPIVMCDKCDKECRLYILNLLVTAPLVDGNIIEITATRIHANACKKAKHKITK